MVSSNQGAYLSRQSRLNKILEQENLSALALNPGPSLSYLTGLQFHLMERPILALFSPDHNPVLVIPELEQAKVSGLPFPLEVYMYGEDPGKWPQSFRQAALAAGVKGKAVGIEPTRLRLLEFRMLKRVVPDSRFHSAESVLSELRVRKDAEEISALRQAVLIAQNALQATLPVIKPGITERQVASELTVQLMRNGSDFDVAFTPIVSGGPNSANPHASPSDRPLQVGDLLVIDWGALHQGYTSDITRTFAIGAVEAEYARIAEIVEKANASAREVVRPGIPTEAVDQAARSVIDQSGYGQYFIHRTGHGIGIEGHEAPYIRSGNKAMLEPGMTFTIEPGIYLPDRGGVRIEDNIVVTAAGSESLTDLPRQLITLPA